jgi:hypothetical protein
MFQRQIVELPLKVFLEFARRSISVGGIRFEAVPDNRFDGGRNLGVPCPQRGNRPAAISDHSE